MSKYQPLWEHIAKVSDSNLQLSFTDIEQILGFPIDHSFLTFKKELSDYGWQVGKITMKGHNVTFIKIN